jgi:uncharacterized lipoprotein YajG
MMRARSLAAVALLLLCGCSAQEITQAQGDADSTVAQAQPTIEMACWLAQAADAGFQAYAASAKADSGVVADEEKAMAAANAVCANPPADVAQAIADVMAAYKVVVAATPAPS